MKVIKRSVTGLLIIALFVLNWVIIRPPAIYACSCMVPGSPAEELEAVTAVFSGQVTAVEAPEGVEISSADPMRVTLAVDQVWKGQVTENVVVTTARDDAACGFNFVQGRDYVVYAGGSETDLTVSLCSRTAELSPDLEDLAVLGPGTAPQPQVDDVSETAIVIPTWLAAIALVLAAVIVLVVVSLFWRRQTL